MPVVNGRLLTDVGAQVMHDLGATAVPSTATFTNGRARDVGGALFVQVVTGAVPAGAIYLSGEAIRADGAQYVTRDAVASDSVILAGAAHTDDGILHISDTADGTTWLAGCLYTGTGVAVVSITALSGAATLVSDFMSGSYQSRAATNVAFTDTTFAGMWTFTRANATATRRNEAGMLEMVAANVARMDYDAVTLLPKGILMEPARTNLVLQSENFGTTWAAVGTPTRNANAMSRGILDLDCLGDDDATALEGYTQTITYTGNAVKSVSFFISKGTATSSVVRLRDTSAPADRLLLAITWTGAVPTVTMTTGTLLGTTDYGGGIYRVRVLTTSATAANTNSLEVYPATDAALDTAAVGTLFIGGVQSENAVSVSSYVPTTTATVARSADLMTHVLGTEFNATEGTLMVSATAMLTNPATGDQYMASLNDGTLNEQISLLRQANTRVAFCSSIFDGGVSQALINTGTIADGATFKLAGAYKLNDCAGSVSGGAAVTDVVATMPTVTTLVAGAAVNTLQPLAHLRQIVYYNTRMSDANLAVISA